MSEAHVHGLPTPLGMKVIECSGCLARESDLLGAQGAYSQCAAENGQLKASLAAHEEALRAADHVEERARHLRSVEDAYGIMASAERPMSEETRLDVWADVLDARRFLSEAVDAYRTAREKARTA